MAGELPLTKLAGLLVKTLAKPLSKSIKHEFSRYEFTQRLLMQIGQTNHQISSRMTIWSAGYKVRSIKPLEDEKALQTGAEFLGESIVFIISGGVLVWEYQRSKEKDKAKEEAHKQKAAAERRDLQKQLHALDVRLQALEETVKRNSQSVLNVLGPKYIEPDHRHIVPIQPPDEEELTEMAAKPPPPQPSPPPPPVPFKKREPIPPLSIQAGGDTVSSPTPHGAPVTATESMVEQETQQVTTVETTSPSTPAVVPQSWWKFW